MSKQDLKRNNVMTALSEYRLGPSPDDSGKINRVGGQKALKLEQVSCASEGTTTGRTGCALSAGYVFLDFC